MQEVQRIPLRINPWRNILRHIVIKLIKIKDKEKILKVTRNKQQIRYKRNSIGYHMIFSRHYAVQREWHAIFKVKKRKKL